MHKRNVTHPRPETFFTNNFILTCIGRVETTQPVVAKPQPIDRQEHASFHSSTLNKHAKPESRQNSIPLNLSAYITDEEAARHPPLTLRPNQPSTPLTAESKQGEDLYFTKAGRRTQGLAKVNNSTSGARN